MNENTVKIFEPDFSLKRKLGGIDITFILNEQVIQRAEKAIDSSSRKIFGQISAEIRKLQKKVDKLKKSRAISQSEMQELIDSAFFVKSKAGFIEYQLITLLAMSLYLFCEKRLRAKSLSEQEIEIIYWHVESIITIFDHEVKDHTSDFGKELQEELKKIKIKFIG